MRSSVVIGIGVGAFALASAALAAPTSFVPQITIETNDQNFDPIDQQLLLLDEPISLGQSILLQPNDTKYAAPVTVSYDAITVGNLRTVTISYESMESYFVTPAAFAVMQQPPEEGSFGIYFSRFFSDAEWNGTQVLHTVKLFAADQLVLESPFNSATLAVGSHGFIDSVSPAEPGFFSSNTTIDRFEQTVTYTIVPAPGAAAPLLAFACVALRRRRGA